MSPAARTAVVLSPQSPPPQLLANSLTSKALGRYGSRMAKVAITAKRQATVTENAHGKPPFGWSRALSGARPREGLSVPYTFRREERRSRSAGRLSVQRRLLERPPRSGLVQSGLSALKWIPPIARYDNPIILVNLGYALSASVDCRESPRTVDAL
jgi:hypothetical protein